jgi:long-chain fatty acid transport protein
MNQLRKSGLYASVAVAALAAVASGASAGGFEVREQSTYFQGTAWAGAAAGGNLSSMFWNPAGLGDAGVGITTNSNYSLLLPQSDITVTGFGAPGVFPPAVAGLDRSVDIARDAIVPASYAAYRLNAATVFGVGINSQFGLGTKPDNLNWVGQFHGRTAELFSMQVNPTVAHEIMPGLIVGGGLQFQYFDLKRFKSALPPTGANTANLHANDVGAGFTAGVLWKPAPGTALGIGYRSSISHGLRGGLDRPPLGMLDVHADVELPEKVTASFRQSLSPNMRVSGTVEWSNWSRLGIIPVVLDRAPVTVANLDFQWEDGWLYSLGAEYDLNAKTQLRAGVAYEKSPIQDPTARLVSLPDADRIWASIGASYRWSETTTIDFAYSHLFVEDSSLVRTNATGTAPLLYADVETDIDIVSVGVTMKLGGAPAAAPLK